MRRLRRSSSIRSSRACAYGQPRGAPPLAVCRNQVGNAADHDAASITNARITREQRHRQREGRVRLELKGSNEMVDDLPVRNREDDEDAAQGDHDQRREALSHDHFRA